ncbi:MAG: DUF3037 domain-containing protein [Ignavibacteriae bacterium]|nr:DUF3037 domain-containing protein [Ignavibacteriota bacterium]
MPEKHVFEYAIVRIVPRVEREEFLNAGIVLCCAELEFLRSSFALDESRLRALNADISIAEIHSQLEAFERICAGGKDAGALGVLPRGERFRWLTAPRSTIIQTSPVHTGFCSDPRERLTHLVETLVK